MTLTDISFECGACGQRLVVDVAGAGTTVACPMCEQDVTVPTGNGKAVTVARIETPRAAAAHDLEHELQTARTDLHTLRTESDRTAAALAQTGAELKDLLAEQSDWQESRRRLEAARVHAEQNRALAMCERAELAKAVAHSGARIAELESLLADIQTSPDSAANTEKAHSQMAEELRRAHAECATMREAMLATRRRFNDLHAQIAEREHECKERNATIHTLLAAQQEAEESIQRLESYRSQAEQDLQQALVAKADISETLAVSRRRVEALETQLEARERDWEERGNTIESLRAELSEIELRLAEVQSELTLFQEEAEKVPGLLATCTALEEEVAALEAEEQDLADALSARDAEIVALQLGLEESEAGREALGALQRAQKAEQERETAVRLQQEAEKEAAKARAEAARWQDDCEEMARRCREAEARAEGAAAGPEDQSTRMLRGILERQASELAERCRELSRLRKERFALRLAYAGVGFLVLGIVALALKVVQNFS